MSLEGINNDYSVNAYTTSSSEEGTLEGRRVTLEGCQGIIRSALAILKQETRTSSHKTFSVSLREQKNNAIDYNLHTEQNSNGSGYARGSAGYTYTDGDGLTFSAGGYGQINSDGNGNTSAKMGTDLNFRVEF